MCVCLFVRLCLKVTLVLVPIVQKLLERNRWRCGSNRLQKNPMDETIDNAMRAMEFDEGLSDDGVRRIEFDEGLSAVFDEGLCLFVRVCVLA